MKREICFAFLLLNITSIFCMDMNEVLILHGQKPVVNKSEEYIVQLASKLSTKLLGQEVPQSVLQEGKINFKGELLEPDDFYDGELVIFTSQDIFAENGLAEPRYGQIKEGSEDQVITYLEKHRLPHYKVIVKIQDEKTFYQLIPANRIRSLPVHLRAQFKPAL